MKKRDEATIRKETNARKDLRHGNSSWFTRSFFAGVNEKRKYLYYVAKKIALLRGKC